MQQLRKLLASLTVRQQITIAVAALAVVAGLFALARWNRERNFRPLFTSLSAEDAGAVVQKLRETGVDYRLDEAGGTVRVPADKVAELRLQMATAGLPKTGRIGFELFDKTNFGVTDFAEQVNYRRALEGELERSVMALSEVEAARVHVSLPKDSVFLESRQEAKASVMVRLRPHMHLPASSVAGICHLVASAVDRLSPEAVSVLDMDGNLLARPRKTSLEDGGEAPEASLDYRQKIERDLVLKINSALEPLLGAEKFRAGASVECDFTRGEQSEEIYDPARSVMLTSQKTEDISGFAQTAGVPGTASNLPRPPARASGPGGGVSRRTENVSYQSSKTVRHVRMPQGTVKRMSLAVLVDNDLRWEGAGAKAKRVLIPPSPEKLKVVRDLVAAATGFSAERGDQLIVESLPFESTLRIEPPPPAGAPKPASPSPWPAPLDKYLNGMNPALVIGVAIGILLMLIGLPLLLLLSRRKRSKAELTGPAALPSSAPGNAVAAAGVSMEEQLASHAAAQEKLEAEALSALRLPPPQTKKGEILAKHLRESAKKDPAMMAQLVRTWLHEEAR
jgi:flagellar M-ring protein FliF